MCEVPTCQISRPRTIGTTKVEIDKNLLRARKFMDDLFREGKELQVFFAGSVRTPYMNIDLDKARRMKPIIHEAVVMHYVGHRPSGMTPKDWASEVLDKTIFKFDALQSAVLEHVTEQDQPMVRRVFAAYQTERPFSVDLLGATLGWTKPNYFSARQDEVALQHAIARYHGFLDILAVNPRSFNVPTLDIDLAWHTHQLMGSKYNSDCREIVGRYIDQ
ncbi:hypothetical protein H0H93_015289 [Arthromyces matolae]|nr:hypothetical protein H0H93_015289 [Arthromyces matolae]